MDIKGVIFDLDGTLGDTFPVIFPAYRRALEKYLGRIYSDDEIMAMFGPTEEGIIRSLVPAHWQDCLHDYMTEYRRLSPIATLHFEGIEEALKELRRRNVLMGIVTGKSLAGALISLADLGFGEYFDAVEGGSIEGVIKPECMRRILQRWNMPPQHAAYVGDATTDMLNAREVGVLPLAAAWCEKADLAGLRATSPAQIFPHASDFLRWIEANVARKNGRHA